MPKRSTDELFQLIQSLSKAEKRNFKLFANRNSNVGNPKTVLLFDLMSRMEEYDDDSVFKKKQQLRNTQLPNLKAALYRQILASIRVLREFGNIESQLNEQLDHARILYQKALFGQCLRMLARVKEQAKTYHQLTYWLQAIIFEKEIELQHITRSQPGRAEALAAEVNELTTNLVRIGELSNLSLELYSWYIRYGHARDESDVLALKAQFDARFEQLSEGNIPKDLFFARMYLYQSRCWFTFIVQDFPLHFRNAQRWVDLFDQFPKMKRVEPIAYIKGLHSLLLSHMMLQKTAEYRAVLTEFEAFAQSEVAFENDNVAIQTFIYLNIDRINFHFMCGTFTEGLALVPEIERILQAHETQIDRHRELIFYYKIASLYFGSGNPSKAIDYLHRIINGRPDLRTDLQCYARLLQLISHYELIGHQPDKIGFLESLLKSVFRFMGGMNNLGKVEMAIFDFIRHSFTLDSPTKVRIGFIQLREQLLQCRENHFERRSFMYLDIISWLESKIEGVAVQDIIQRKFRQNEKN
jgi:hypothetical protein